MSILKNFKRRGFKDALNPRKWRIFFRYVRSWVKSGLYQSKAEEAGIPSKTLNEYSELTTPHELEQIVWRMSQESCRECLISGSCTHCGCASPELFYDRENWCSGMHWLAMVDEEMWTYTKAAQGIQIDQDYLNEVSNFGKIKNFKDGRH